jgi:hypothetical protein
VSYAKLRKSKKSRSRMLDKRIFHVDEVVVNKWETRMTMSVPDVGCCGLKKEGNGLHGSLPRG